jgi:hypothetical protein
MTDYTALIVTDAVAEKPGEKEPHVINDLSLIRKAPGVKGARRHPMSPVQRFQGPWPYHVTVVTLDGEAGAKAWVAHNKAHPEATKNSVVGVFESMRPRKGEPDGVPTTHMMVAMTTPDPARDAEYNDWYWDRHMPDGLRLPGVISGERFKIRPDLSDAKFPYQYMALYDMRIDDLAVHIKETNRVSRTPEMPVTDAVVKGYAWYVMPAAG